MPKSNDQIRREHDALPWYARAGENVLDNIRIVANGLTVGGVNAAAKGIVGLQNPNVSSSDLDATMDALHHEARVRQGIVGDIANVGGQLYGLGKVFKAGKAALPVAKTLPTAARLVPTAGLGTAARYMAGTAGPGVVPVAAQLTKGAIAKGAGYGATIATLLGLSAAGRQDATPAAAVAKPTTAAAPVKVAPTKVAPRQLTTQERMSEGINRILSSPNMTLSDRQAAAGLMATITPKPISAADAAIGEAAQRMYALNQQELKAAGTNPELGVKAMENDLARWLMLAGKGQQAAMLPPVIDAEKD